MLKRLCKKLFLVRKNNHKNRCKDIGGNILVQKKRIYVESKNTSRQLIVSLIYTMYFIVDIGVVAVVWLETTTHSKFSLEILTLISK